MEIPPLSQRLNFRNQHFHTINKHAFHQDRQSFSIELRKKKRRIHTNIKRNLSPTSLSLLTESSSLQVLISTYTDTESLVFSILSLLSHQSSAVPVFECLVALNRLTNSACLATAVLKSSYLPILTSYLSFTDTVIIEKISFLFVTLSCGETELAGISSAVDRLIYLYRTCEGVIEKNALCALCNFAKGSGELRKYLIGLELDREILQQLLFGVKTQEQYLEFLTYLCRDCKTDQISENYLKLVFLIMNPENPKPQSKASQLNACLILHFLTYYNPKSIEALMHYQELFPILIQIANAEENPKLVKAACLIFANVSGSNASHTQCLLNHNILFVISKLIQAPCSFLRKEAYFILGNITAGTYSQIKSVLDYNSLISDSFLGVSDPVLEVRINAWHMFLNITKFGSGNFALEIIQKGLICTIGPALFAEKDLECIHLALQCVECLVSAANEDIEIMSDLYTYSIFEWVAGSKYHKSVLISVVATRILEFTLDF